MFKTCFIRELQNIKKEFLSIALDVISFLPYLDVSPLGWYNKHITSFILYNTGFSAHNFTM